MIEPKGDSNKSATFLDPRLKSYQKFAMYQYKNVAVLFGPVPKNAITFGRLFLREIGDLWESQIKIKWLFF